MASKTYCQYYADGTKKLPVEIKAKRVNITLTPQAHKRGVALARSKGKTFSAWIDEQIYKSIHTEID